MDKYAQKLFQSRQFERPGALMIEKVNNIIYGAETNDSIKIYMESAHDTQLLSTLLWLQPADFDYIDMPFSSSIYFELHYN